MSTSNLNFRLINFLGAIAWILISLIIYPSQAWGQLNQTSHNVNNKKLRFIPPPRENNNNGDGRTEDEKTTAGRNPCPNVIVPLTPLIPKKNLPALTVSKQPTLWFYMPYTLPDLQNIEFDLRDQNNNRVYNPQFKLSENQNFISIEISHSLLKLNQKYEWFLYVYCNPNNSSDYVDVTGSFLIQQSNPSLNRELEQAKNWQEEIFAYANNGIWHDAVHKLTELRCQQPNNVTIKNDWISFLESVGLEEISKINDIKCYKHKQ